MQVLYFPLMASLSYTALAQYFPPTPEDVITLKSKYHEGVKISYKEVSSHKLIMPSTLRRANLSMALISPVSVKQHLV